MKFTVTWLPSAEARLTQIWLAARDRQSIQEANSDIESVLAVRPLTVGESRAGRFRIYCSGPLAVIYSVSEMDRLVTVAEVTRTRLGHRGR
ncbi:MAG: hypothetical protein ACKV2Q_06390 [Planctomycetaceae bacterium]